MSSTSRHGQVVNDTTVAPDDASDDATAIYDAAIDEEQSREPHETLTSHCRRGSSKRSSIQSPCFRSSRKLCGVLKAVVSKSCCNRFLIYCVSIRWAVAGVWFRLICQHWPIKFYDKLDAVLNGRLHICVAIAFALFRLFVRLISEWGFRPTNFQLPNSGIDQYVIVYVRNNCCWTCTTMKLNCFPTRFNNCSLIIDDKITLKISHKLTLFKIKTFT